MNTPDPKPRKGIALGSAAIGAAAILGSLLAFSGGAGAQDAPELSEPTAAAVVADDAAQIDGVELIELDGMGESFALDGAYDADFAAYDDCLQTELGIDFESADEAAWMALSDDAWDAADAACEDQLPAEILEMDAAFEKYDDCLADNGINFEDEIFAVDGLGDEMLIDDLGNHVFIEAGEAFSMAEFGDADGTITISQTDGVVEVLGEGDVEIVDFDEVDFNEMDFEEIELTDAEIAEFEVDEEWEAAHQACEGELPEDLMLMGDAVLEGDVEMFDLEDDIHEVPADA